MTDKNRPPKEGASLPFRAMRRRSGSSLDDGVLNIFDTDPVEPAQDAPPPGPPRVETATRRLGHLRVLLAPEDCPKDLTQALRDKVRNIGRFCDKALLFQAEYDGGESSLMICLSAVRPDDQARIEGAVADTLMTTGYEDRALGILFLDPDAPALERIRGLAVDLKAAD